MPTCASDDSEHGGSSNSDWDDHGYDSLEKTSMRALDAKLAEIPMSESGSAVPAGSASAVNPDGDAPAFSVAGLEETSFPEVVETAGLSAYMPPSRQPPEVSGGISDESEHGGSSESNWDDSQWDALEKASLRALDAKLAEVCPDAPCVPSPTVQFTADSTLTDSSAMMLPSSLANPQPAPNQPATASTEMSAPAGAHSSLAKQAQRLEEACRLEPYRPEDHVLTADEMWQGWDSDTELDIPAEELACGRGVVVGPSFCPFSEHAAETGTSLLNPARASAVHVVAPVAGMALPTRGAGPEDVAAVPEEAERLRRLLAGDQAPNMLAGLNFGELAAVADDCERAVATLRWVLQQQRVMLGGGSST